MAKILEKDNKVDAALNVLAETEKRISGLSKSSEDLVTTFPEVIYHQGHLYQKSGKANEAYNRYRFLHIAFPTNQLTQLAKEKMNKLAKDT